jgi:hypothetical protein
MKVRIRGLTGRSLLRSFAWIQCLIHCAKICMEFTRRGGLPKTDCLLRVKTAFVIAGCAGSAKSFNRLPLGSTFARRDVPIFSFAIVSRSSTAKEIARHILR